MSAILTLTGVGKRFPGVVALRGVSIDVARGRGPRAARGERGGQVDADQPARAASTRPTTARSSSTARPTARDPDRRLPRRHPRRASGAVDADADDGGGKPDVRAPAAAARDRRLPRDEPARRRAARGGRPRHSRRRPRSPGSASLRCSSIEIAKTLVFESRLLILDEPTATLTSKEVDRLFAILRRLKSARRDDSLHLAPAAGDRRDRRPGHRAAGRAARRHARACGARRSRRSCG